MHCMPNYFFPFAVNHESNLFWTEQVAPGHRFVVRGIPGLPSDWARSGDAVKAKREHLFQLRAAGTPNMLALGFRYSSRELFFTDRGLRTIFRLELQDVQEMYNVTEDTTEIPSDPDTVFNHTRLTNYTLHAVYSGISGEASGIAVDWLADTLYWTDARYNWIGVASTRHHIHYTGLVDGTAPRGYEVYKYLITKDMDKPWGIAVYPMKGWAKVLIVVLNFQIIVGGGQHACCMVEWKLLCSSTLSLLGEVLVLKMKIKILTFSKLLHLIVN